MRIGRIRHIQTGLFQPTNRNRSLVPGEKNTSPDFTVIVSALLILAGMLVALYAYFFLMVNPLAAAGLSATVVGMAGFATTRNTNLPLAQDAEKFRKNLKKFIAILAIVLTLTDALVLITDRAAFISVYFIANVLAFNVVTLAFYKDLGQKTKMDLKVVASILFLAFIGLVAYKISLMLTSP